MVTPKQLLHAHETIRKHANEREFPAQLQSIFLLIASKGGDMAQNDIAPVLGLSASSVSRNLSWLGPRNKLKRRSGLRWIEIYECPKNYKANRVKLTALGRQIIDEAISPSRPSRTDLLSEETLREAVLSL